MMRQRHYQINDRKALKKGDFFRPRGGPYYINSRGKRVSMASRGVMMFMYYCEKDDQHWIEAYSTKEKSIVVLSLDEGRESPLPGSYITRPYYIKGVVNPERVPKLLESIGGRRALPAVRGRRGAVMTPKTRKPKAAQKTSGGGIADGKAIVQKVLGGFSG